MQNTTLLFAMAAVMTGLTVYLSIHGKPGSTNSLKEFSNFKQKFGIVHNSQAELEYRFQVFQSNLDQIKDINDSNKTFEAAVNQFSDLTFDEFKNKYLSKQAIPLKYDDLLTSSNVKGSVDWRKEGHVSEVKNQEQCGSCWAFSTTGSLEAALSIFSGKKVSLSEQQLVDCDDVDQGCNGGLMDYAYQYIEENGLTTEDNYSYVGYEQDCSYDTSMENYRPKSHQAIEPANVNGLMSALMKQPVSVAIEVQSDFMHYSRGVYQNNNCGTRLNHGVLAVGFNNEDTNETPYFIVKNSWSAMWGDKGYVKMAIGKRSYGTCGIANASDVYPVL